MKLFFENVTEDEKVPMDFPLEAVLEQVLDLFGQLPESDGSSFGLVTDSNLVIQFSKYNRFMWMVEIPEIIKMGVHRAILNKYQCVRLIEDLYTGADPFTVCEFKFKSYL